MTIRGKLGFAALMAAALLAFSPLQAQQQWAPNPAADHGAGALAGERVTDLAKKLQNPIGDLTVIPLQNDTNFNAGPHRGTQNILNIQPIIPFSIKENWNLVTRTILPLMWQPSLQPARTVRFGSGPITWAAYLSPKNISSSGWSWRVGPVVQIPTASNASLGSNV